MSVSTPLATAEQLFAMPSDGLRRELVQGEIITMNPAGLAHGEPSARLAWLLGNHVYRHHLGAVVGAATGFVISRNPDTVRAPDVAFVRQQRVAVVAALQGFFPESPDLAVEVISPSDRPGEIEVKVNDWISHGTALVWLIDPRRRTVAVYRSHTDKREFGEHEFLEAPDLLPGFRLSVAEIFPGA